MTIEYTANLHYPKPDFDTKVWHQQMHDFADQVDRDVSGLTVGTSLTIPNWVTSHFYAIGSRAYDPEIPGIYQALVAHTSSGEVFSTYRASNPTHWQQVSVLFDPRGEWAQNTQYNVLDHAYDTSEGISAVCLTAHLSSATGTIRTDAAKWDFIVDLQAALTGNDRFQLIMELQVFS